MLLENQMSSVWKLGSPAAGSTAVYREKLDKYIFSNTILNYWIFSSHSYYSTSRFLHGHILFHLDNPNPDPVERKTISNTNPKKSQYSAGLDSKTRILYTTGVHQRWARIRTGSDWIRTEANYDRIRIGSDCNFFQNWRIRTGSDWENFCCFHVIILKISKILVVIRFHRFA